jgi:hypothetical protein
MKTTIKLLAILALMLVTLGQHTPASAAYTENDKWRWTTAYAVFESVDPSGCIHTEVYVYAEETWSEVGLSISQYDTCIGTYLLIASGYAELADSDFRISANLDSATLKTTVDVEDYVSDSSFDVFVDLTWTGTSALGHGTSNYQGHGPGCHEISHDQMRSRAAQASGTVSDGETNFTLEPSEYGVIYSEKFADIYGCHPMTLATVSQQIAAAIGDLENYKYSGAYAGAYSVDPSGCISTSVWLSAGDVIVDPGRGSASSFMDVNVAQYDDCTHTPLLWARGDIGLAEPDFQISGNRAALHKMVTVYDPDRNLVLDDVLVDLTWKASGPLNQNVYTFQWHGPDCQQHGRETWGWREAKASGTISSAEADFTLAPSGFAEIDWDRYVVDWCD